MLRVLLTQGRSKESVMAKSKYPGEESGGMKKTPKKQPVPKKK